MKHLLTEGEMGVLMSDSGAGGLSGEVHLIKYNSEKYVVRRCDSYARARNYEWISKRFGKYGFLPEFLGRTGKNVFYEYLPGRDLRKDEQLGVFEEIGEIAAYINEVRIKGSIKSRFYRQVRELVSGNFAMNPKVLVKRSRVQNWKKPKPIFDEPYARQIRTVFRNLSGKTNPSLTLDANDINPSNFRLNKGRVYFVDIEAIKPRIKGLGIGKCYLTWAKTTARRKAFEKGYSNAASISFLTPEYLDFIFLNFLIQRINYHVHVFQDEGYKRETEMLDEVLNKYSL